MAGLFVAGGRIVAGRGGIIARGNRASAKTGITTESGVLRIDSVSLVSGRLYRLAVEMRPFSTTGTDTWRVRFRYSTTGTATTASTELKGAEGQSHRTCDLWALYVPGANQTMSLLLTLARATGAGTFSSDGETSGTDLIIEDLGVDAGDTGVDA